MIGIGRRIIDKATGQEYVIEYVSQNEKDDWVYWAKEAKYTEPETICIEEAAIERDYYIQMALHRSELGKEQQKANDKHHRKSAVPYLASGW